MPRTVADIFRAHASALLCRSAGRYEDRSVFAGVRLPAHGPPQPCNLIGAIASRSESWSARCLPIIRAARSRVSGEKSIPDSVHGAGSFPRIAPPPRPLSVTLHDRPEAAGRAIERMPPTTKVDRSS